MKPQLFIQIRDKPEFEINNLIPEFQFLGKTETPNIVHTYTDITGWDGAFYNNTAMKTETIKANFILHYRDYYHLKALRHEIYSTFMTGQEMRIRTDAEPMMVEYVRAKSFAIEPSSPGSLQSLVTIEFENAKGYKYSRYRSDELDDDWDTFDLATDVIQLDKSAFIINNQQSFTIINPSDYPIDPYFHNDDLIIRVKTEGHLVSITNVTTGEHYEWSNSDSQPHPKELIIRGVNSYLNENLVDAWTNFATISLAKGENNFRVNCSGTFEITFSYPFKYV